VPAIANAVPGILSGPAGLRGRRCYTLDEEPLIEKSWLERAGGWLFGAPRNLFDPSIFHKLSLIPVLAWVGLGGDGLSSSAYGPAEAFTVVLGHPYLAVGLGLATAVTVFVISYAYSRIIEHFPYGGGGYVVATHMLGEKFGIVSGCALLVDYILTITVSVVACADAVFSFLPYGLQGLKEPAACIFILILILLNVRGVKESVQVLAPIFLAFVVTHVLLIGYGIYGRIGAVGTLAVASGESFARDVGTLGIVGLALLFIRAYSMGAGTYTGIEAVSNGLMVMREPRVHTAKKTMVYMAVSLALTSAGLLLCFFLWNLKPVEGMTLNAVLSAALYGNWPLGNVLAFVTIFSEGALLLVAAQAGFVDGPRVMANMAIDSWFPHRFAALSERLTMRNGVLLMGIGALFLTLFTGGSITVLIVMYSINVFLTFTLSELGMVRFYLTHRRTERRWQRHISVHVIGLILCATILSIMFFEKFPKGGWLTLLITGIFIGLCYVIRRHYEKVGKATRSLDAVLTTINVTRPPTTEPLKRGEMTAIQLVPGFTGIGVHTLLSIIRNFPHLYKQFIFVSVGVVDSGSFKGIKELEALKKSVIEALEKYCLFARRLGFPAEYRYAVGTDVVDAATHLCQEAHAEYPHSTVFGGQLTFRLEKIYHALLHNETAFAIQRRLQWSGITAVILPIRVKLRPAPNV
jgi:amino acid transporter